MIAATVLKGSEGYRGFRITGHAAFAESGTDIICAAVSVLSINTVNALESLTQCHIETVSEDGFLECSFPDGLDHDGMLLMESMLLGLNQIAELVPEEEDGAYLQLFIEEV